MPSTFCNLCKSSILVCFSKPLPDPWLLAFIYRIDLAEFAKSSNLAKMLIKSNFHRLQKICTSNGMFCLCALLLYPWFSCINPQTVSGGSLSVAKLCQKCWSRRFSPGMRTLTSQMCWSVPQKSWLTFFGLYSYRISLHGILLPSVDNVRTRAK